MSVSPSCNIFRQRSRAGRFVVAPDSSSLKIFLHPARCNAFICMSAFWSIVEMRA